MQSVFLLAGDPSVPYPRPKITPYNFPHSQRHFAANGKCQVFASFCNVFGGEKSKNRLKIICLIGFSQLVGLISDYKAFAVFADLGVG